ncbi:MAG: hydrogenase [Candidatus Bathyarchaeota archaeon]
MSILGLSYCPWSPVFWLLALAVVTIMAYFFRSRGQKKYKKGTDQAKIFLCGEEVPDAEQRHIRAHNVYWGFFETLKEYYDTNIKAHTGIINDYVIWFLVLMAIGAITLFVVGLVK